MICVFCGRPLKQAFMMIGREAVGPKCAKKRLDVVAKQKGSKVVKLQRKRTVRTGDNWDLFDD